MGQVDRDRVVGEKREQEQRFPRREEGVLLLAALETINRRYVVLSYYSISEEPTPSGMPNPGSSGEV